MFIQTEDTPNPLTMKFLPNRAVLGDQGSKEFTSEESAQGVSPLAESLFGIEGVQGVFLGQDFISITRDETHEWQILRPILLQTIIGYFLSGQPLLTENSTNKSACGCGGLGDHEAQDDEISKLICKVLDERIRPAVAQDGGDITFDHYADGVAYLRLRGACSGCPSATATLKVGVERLLNAMIPEVQEVRQVR